MMRGRGDCIEGLSPRVRGNQGGWSESFITMRSIPACAGEPTASKPKTTIQEVYPRVCGGTAGGDLAPGARNGLSPRVRGNPADRLDRHQAKRSIPACAGEPGRARRILADAEVYPRVCGGTSIPLCCSATMTGLSPRVRGNLRPRASDRPSAGSIPACAGEPAHTCSSHWPVKVYPRVCGGTTLKSPDARVCQGLSPRVRGNRPLHSCRRRDIRSIPACAGEPVSRNGEKNAEKVYPRVCGGTPVDGGPRVRQQGLSPRVRGNPGAFASVKYRHRSIPACAGEPMIPGLNLERSKVYPRVCGGTRRRLTARSSSRGLSPRVRGNL